MVPPEIQGKVVSVVNNGRYNIEDTLIILDDNDKKYELKMYQKWPIRQPRPVNRRMPIKNC